MTQKGGGAAAWKGLCQTKQGSSLFPLLNIYHRDPWKQKESFHQLTRQYPFGLTLFDIDDNTPLSHILRAVLSRRITSASELDTHLQRNGRFLYFTGHYPNVLTHYSAYKRYLDDHLLPRLFSEKNSGKAKSVNKGDEHQSPVNEEPISYQQLKRKERKEHYLRLNNMSFFRSRLLNRLTVGIDEKATTLLGVKKAAVMPEGNPLHRFLQQALESVRAEITEKPQGALIGFGDYLAFKGAWQYEEKGVEMPELGYGARLTVRYGVFPPTRKDYIDLFARKMRKICREQTTKEQGGFVKMGGLRTPALEVGAGSGVLSFIMHKYGVNKVVGTDIYGEAVACAEENARRLGYATKKKKGGGGVTFVRADMFPSNDSTKYDLIVCNPPWVPLHDTTPTTTLMDESTNVGVFDYDFLGRLFEGVSKRLNQGGRFLLIYSDFAFRMGLLDDFPLPSCSNKKSSASFGWVGEWMDALCDAYGLKVYTREETPAMVDVNPKDPFYDIRTTEVISLYEIGWKN